jgi:xanthine dehydrogenase accessory factor
VSAADNARILRELAGAVDAGRPVALATIVDTKRSVPRHRGTKMLVFSDGSSIGTVGGGELEARVRRAALDAMRRGSATLIDYDLVDVARGDPGVCGGSVAIYLEPYMPPHTVYVIGCGHVGRAVVDLAHWLGFRTVAADDRADLVTAEAVPEADVRFAGSVPDLLAAHPVPDDASMIVVTRSAELDAAILPDLVATPARYIGVMGSKRRWRTTRAQLEAAGLAADRLDSIHVPIGIDLNAETVEEIAVSILSEVIRVNRTAGT